jgi:hypothetical protein
MLVDQRGPALDELGHIATELADIARRISELGE